MQLNVATELLIRSAHQTMAELEPTPLPVKLEIDSTELRGSPLDGNSIADPLVPGAPTQMKSVLVLEYQRVAVLTQWLANAVVVLFFPWVLSEVGTAITFGFLNLPHGRLGPFAIARYLQPRRRTPSLGPKLRT